MAETVPCPVFSGTMRGSVLPSALPKGVGEATRLVGDAFCGGDGDVAGPSVVFNTLSAEPPP